uniref:non-specific serine/threonine protein kinase n=1 Tax=Musa acuminata subsp. malaccensis TaxID=214687 RepID=A0A804J1Z2_MUSAM
MSAPKTGSSIVSTAIQRVVVIQDASKEISSSAIKWAIDGLSLQPGDELTLFGVLHQFNTPMGYKSSVDSNSMLAANNDIIKQEVARREEEYRNSAENLNISQLYESKKIGFSISVVAESSPKEAALKAANRLKATWIILDRQMKKDKNYFMERLSCGIYRMKRNSCVELLREPKVNQRNDEFSNENVSKIIRYNEMITGTEIEPLASNIVLEFTDDDDDYDDDDLFSVDISPRGFRNYVAQHSSIHLQEEDNYMSIQIAEENKGSLAFKMQITQNDNDDIKKQETENNNIAEETLIYGLEYPICKQCGNGRQKNVSVREFTYAELYTATNGFSKKHFLSKGGFGSVYRGTLTDGQCIAVKQYKHVSSQGETEFRSEVHVLGTLQHKNVVMLLGSCSEGNHRLLVYEYVCNGSLNQHLSKSSPYILSWKHRMKILLGTAAGLNYLHQNNIIHRDMSPNNILLTHEYEPMLGDFGLSRKQQDQSCSLSESNVVGTFGYLAPEYTERGRVSTKTDVYSFGVILLEVITGRTTINKNLEDKSLVGWARPLLRERKYPELIDERILDCHDLHQLFWMITVAEQCLRKDPDKRPTMEKVEYILKCTIDGKTVGSIDDFSPPHSSISSLPMSNDSQEFHIAKYIHEF